MAGGLAKQGMVPVVALYSTFLQRSYDQILQDIAMLRLHVVLAIDRAGLVGEDGETHHGVFDVGFLRQAQGLQILCPASTDELKQMLCWAVSDCQGPVALRYPRGGNGDFTASCWNKEKTVVCHKSGKDGAIVTYGTLVNHALKASEVLSKKGFEVSVIRLLAVNPLPTKELTKLLFDQKRIVIAEEGIGGIAEILAWQISQELPNANIVTADLGHEYVPHGDMDSLYKHYGLDPQSLAELLMEVRKLEE
jgi:1-deoxy-D-xylulose-5-phosphate synthase